MPEKDLDGPQVGAGLQEVSGEAVPEGVDGDVLAEPRGLPSPLAGLAHRGGGDRPLGVAAREQPDPWAGRPPVGPQQLQEFGESIDVAVLGPLPCRTRITMRWLSMSSTRRAATSETRSPAA